ncbi:hypothetical protein HDR61_00325 [bacterium]|nr:hypothetical protein [bacterium]
MNNNSHQSERGGIAFNITLIMLLIVIGILAYMLIAERQNPTGRNIGNNAPQIQTPPKHAQNVRESDNGVFNDGLGHATASTEYPLDDVGAGLARRDMFRYDINNDGRMDRITRSRTETGTSHFSYEYKIELNTENGFVDITPPGFNTVEGAECSLQKIRFTFEPTFQAIKISRPWQETWITPTPATRDVYDIKNNMIELIDSRPMPTVCDVAELF